MKFNLQYFEKWLDYPVSNPQYYSDGNPAKLTLACFIRDSLKTYGKISL